MADKKAIVRFSDEAVVTIVWDQATNSGSASVTNEKTGVSYEFGTGNLVKCTITDNFLNKSFNDLVAICAAGKIAYVEYTYQSKVYNLALTSLDNQHVHVTFGTAESQPQLNFYGSTADDPMELD